MEQLLLNQSIGRALNALPAFVPDDVTLVFQLPVVESIHQESHAITLEPQSEFELVRRKRLEVICTVKIRVPLMLLAPAASRYLK